MPITVDHEQRRNKIAEITADIIANEGLDKVTIRHVAAKAGFSTTIVTHYFANKLDLLTYTQRTATTHARSLVETRYAADKCDLKGCLESLMPIDKGTLKDWKVYFAYWHVATVDQVFARQQRRGINNARNNISRVLVNMVEQNLLPADTDTLLLARRLLIFVQGIAIQAVVNPYEWSPKKQRQFLDTELTALLQ